MTLEEWQTKAKLLFGDDPLFWEFKCPSCGHKQSLRDFIVIGLLRKQADNYIAFSCIGHFRQTDPDAHVVAFGEFDLGWGCKYVGGKVPNVSPIELVIDEDQVRPTFAFAE